MDKNSNNYYLESIKSKIKRLDIRKSQYEEELIQQNKVLEYNISHIQKLKFTNDILHDQYNSLTRLLEKQGIVFQINLREYKPHQWENLFIVKTSKGYEIHTKTGNTLMLLEENFSKIIQDINKKDSYSLIVMRVTDKAALVQLRFN
jgi:septum formation inhibitor MinC